MNRRRFVLSTASVAAIAGCSPAGSGFAPQTFGAPSSPAGARAAGLSTRLEIEEFSANAKLVAALRRGVQAMRAIADPRDVNGWGYWHNSHWMETGSPPPDMVQVWDQCRHGQSFFLAWHRGYLHYFEAILRAASGDPELTLPYWDYYKNPNLPKIFAEPTQPDGSENPLYWANRRSSVVQGLSYTSFQGSITHFPWGPGDTFEDLCERNPHNRVHNQVGGSMGEVPSAPADPIFYLHHCNIDRYWSCWLAAGGKRHMPAAGDLWWRQSFYYNLSRTWGASVRTMNDTRNLGYVYSDTTFPKAPANAILPLRPAVAYRGGANAAGPIRLSLVPITVEIPLEGAAARARELEIELDGVALTATGQQGGFDFSVYANLPETRTSLGEEGRFLVGEFGPFELSMGAMTAMAMSRSKRLRFTATGTSETLRVSFVAFGRPEGIDTQTDLASVAAIRVVPI